MKNIAISIKNISKIYRIYKRPLDRLKDELGLSKSVSYDTFEALKKISFDVYKGETVAIIGTNGSGKSTLLKIIADVVEATTGTISVNGKISAILELGTGFNQELSGYENIYQNGLILGYTKAEIDEKIDAIISFSELDSFIYRPVKTYSSGMYARLAFSVAINVDPDILIVDEALSVGDARFQQKCFKKIKSMQESGVTILFVSHSLDSVIQLCDRAVLLDKGSMIMIGETKDVVKEYNQRLFGDVNKESLELALEMGNDDEIVEDTIVHELIKKASKTLDAKGLFKDIVVKVLNKNREPFQVCISGELIYVEVLLYPEYDIRNLSVAVEIVDKKGMLLTGESTFNKLHETFSVTKGQMKKITFAFLSEFIEDDYFVQVRINRITKKDRSDNVLLYINEQAGSFTLTKNLINRQWFKVKKTFQISITEQDG